MMRDTSHLLTTYSHCPMCIFTASGAFTLQEAWFSIVFFVKPQSNRHTELLTGNLKIKPRAAGECVTMLLTNFDLLCDLLLNRPTATWNLLVYKPAYCAGSKLNGFYRKSYIFPASWLAKALSSIAFFFPKRWFCFEAFCCYQYSLMWFFMNSSQASLGWCYAPLTFQPR